MGIVTEPLRPDAAELQRHWDRRFLDHDGRPWGADPNRTVVETVEPLPAGAALDLGAGEGRNARWLAEHGWRVTAVDLSRVALEQLLNDSRGRGWDLTLIHADLRSWTPPAGTFDLVLLSFVHLPQPDRGRLHRLAARALRRGGTLVLVAHDRSNLDRGTGGPQDARVLPTAAELSHELEELTLDHADVIERPVDGRPAARDLLVVARRAD